MNLSKFIMAAKKIFSKLKGVTHLPYFKRYIILALTLTIIFVIFTFPFEIIVMNQLKKMEGRNFKNVTIKHITVKQLSISLLRASYIENLAVTFMNGDSISINNLTVDISFIALIRKKLTGTITASRIACLFKRLRIECETNLNLDLKIDESLATLPDGKIKAKIDNMRISPGPEELFDGFLNLKPVKISADIDLYIANRLLTIKNFTVSGDDLRGKITGNVMLAPILDNSKLNLKISAEPDSILFEEFQPLLKSFIDASGKITLSLSGTAARRKIEFGKNQSGGNTEIPPFETNPEE